MSKKYPAAYDCDDWTGKIRGRFRPPELMGLVLNFAIAVFATATAEEAGYDG